MKDKMLQQAKSYDEQAFACNAEKEYTQALHYYTKSLEIKEQIYGVEHEEIAIACRNIAVIYENLLKYGTALSFYERALQISHAVELEDNIEIYRLYSYIGNLYMRLGEFDKSLEFLEKARTQSEEDLGEHLETAKIYSYMASLYIKTEEYEPALEMEQKALWIYKEVMGEEDGYTLDCYHSQFLCYLHLKIWDKADELAAKLLNLSVQCFGENSCEVFECLYDIANSCFMAKEYERALDAFHKILALKDVDGQKMMEVYNSMGRIYQELNDSEQTFLYFMKAHELMEDVHTENTATICNNIATYFCDHEHYHEAVLLHNKAITIREELHGINHPITAQSFNNLAFTYSKMGDYQAAFKLYHKTLAIRLETLGELHDDTILSIRNLAYTYSESGENEIALEFYEKLLQIHLKKHGENHSETANAMFSVGIIHYNLGKATIAMEYYKKALELAKELQDTELESEILQYMNLILPKR